MYLLLPLFLQGLFPSRGYARSIPSTKICCADVPAPRVPGAVILSITREEKRNLSISAVPPTLSQNVTNLDVCEITVTLQHKGSNDEVNVQTWLPLHGWNRRFLGVGGGAWAAGLGAIDLALPASQGYAVSSTDAGLSGSPLTPAAWALKADGTVNYDLLENFASRSIHDMAIVGKSVTADFYGRPARSSFWNGCSTGGRQGIQAAGKYPNDFNGILAGSPAIYWTEYVVAELWPQVVMKEEGYYPTNCELDGIVKLAVASCDKRDKIRDGVIDDPFQCNFDPFRVIGKKVECDEGQIAITHQAASIVRKIWDGPTSPSGEKLWYGLPIGASLVALANTTSTISGTNGQGVSFGVADAWARYFVKADPDFDTASLDSQGLTNLFYESKTKFGSIMDSSNPDLRPFKKAGGKLIVWHGLSDQLIFPQDSIRYLKEVEKVMGGEIRTRDFFRLFLAPGVDHCGYGPTSGAVPSSPFESLVSWVEKDHIPAALEAETLANASTHFTRKICSYPLVAKYRGYGDVSVSKSYTCVK
ncbi:Tannase/feruloyl esterase [Thelonectria olida]|uniref:Carboxylic ester hydrolase n=1 Tax=Thelonectria olida TaxID=1576542 RepID=A0A9P9AKD0_9HYPO|nr:Tannase/feruloyl esterase [Thelonectria olida]